MFKYIIKRVFQGILILFIVSLISFFALKVIPGDPAVLILGTEASSESLAIIRESMGLDEPYLKQYLTWILAALKGDLGKSYYFGQSVTNLILERLPLTTALALYSTLISFILALLLGVLAGVKKGKWSDIVIRLTSQVSSSMPSFWLGVLFLNYFAARLGWFGVTAEVDFKASFWDSIWNLTLPASVLALTNLGPLVRQFRTSTIEALQSDYILSAKIKGLSTSTLIFKYVLRSALVTPLSLTSLQLAGLFGGTAVTEQVFSLSGIGRLLVIAVEQRDMALLQGLILVICSIVVLISIINDILMAVINPEIDLESELVE